LGGTGQIELDDFRRARAHQEKRSDVASPLQQPGYHPIKLFVRISQPGQLWPPFFLVNIWLILRLERWDGARLSAQKREEVLSELFDQWLEQRCRQLLAGETPPPLPLHLLSEAA